VSRRDYVDKIPVLTRTQRRLERRQMWMMIILMAAVTVASFFLGVMVGERSASTTAVAAAGPAVAQVAPPPPPPGVATAPRKLTFYDDLPKGNSAPLGSGINLPKGGYPVSTPVSSAPAAATSTSTTAPPPVAPPAPAVVNPPPAPKSALPAVASSGSYVVQVVSTRDEAEARRIIGKLQGIGVSAHQERVDLGAKGIWYRVVAGPYSDQTTAGQVAEKVKKQKYAAIVRKK